MTNKGPHVGVDCLQGTYNKCTDQWTEEEALVLQFATYTNVQICGQYGSYENKLTFDGAYSCREMFWYLDSQKSNDLYAEVSNDLPKDSLTCKILVFQL